MSAAMTENVFLNFYKSTVLGYSKNLQKYVCDLLNQEGYITFDKQESIFDKDKKILFKSKKDWKNILETTTMTSYCIPFYEYWEFIKLYKYSVPFFYEIPDEKELLELIKSKDIVIFDEKQYQSKYIINVTLEDAEPLCLNENENIFLKFVLQKSFVNQETFDRIDYRYPIVIYFNEKGKYLEIRYDSTKYNTSNNENYEKIINDCINWLKSELQINLYICDHRNLIEVIKNADDKSVKLYKQMMEMSSGGSAELTAAESSDYVLPFVGEIRELIDENEELFSECSDAKQLILKYLDDKEATANYPYIYVKKIEPVESQSYMYKVIFDYLNHRYTLLQHITGSCKDLGMERMNNVIKYLCESSSFVKGEKIEY